MDLAWLAEVGNLQLPHPYEHTYQDWHDFIRLDTFVPLVKRIMTTYVPTKSSLDLPKALPRYSCALCDAHFDTVNKLISHHARVHHYRNPFRDHVDTPWCPICLKYFHTVDRVIRHLSKNGSPCAPVVLAQLPALGEREEAKKPATVTTCIAPCIQASGPLIYIHGRG